MSIKNYECDGQLSIFDIIPAQEQKEPEHVPPIHKYLRYGPHTLIPEVRKETKAWLDRNGIPEWVEWSRYSLPCENCTWWDVTNCCSG